MITRKPFLLVAPVLLAFALAHCSGDDGVSTLVRVGNEAAGANCVSGGFQIVTGVDDNTNGTLDDNEIDATSYACNGTPAVPDANDRLCSIRRGGSCPNADLRNLTLGFSDGTEPDGLDLTDMDFSGADLRGAFFGEVVLDHARFVGARLDGMTILGGSMLWSDLSNASAIKTFIIEVYMNGANLSNSDFTDAGLFIATPQVVATSAKFVRTSFGGTPPGDYSDFSGADFTDASGFPGAVGGKFTNANFTRTGLSGANFTNAPSRTTDLSGAIFDFATLVGANFTASNVAAAASFTNAYVTPATLLPAGVDLISRGAIDVSVANLSSKDLHALREFVGFASKNLTSANLTGLTGKLDFTGATLNGANLTNVVFTTGGKLDGADCTGANFTNADLEHVTVTAGTTFATANFTRASLSGLNLLTINMAGATLSHASLFATDLDSTTGAASWTNAFVRATTFPGAPTGYITVDAASNLTGVDLSGIKLHGFLFAPAAIFTNANLSDAQLDAVQFKDCVMAGANFTNSNLEGADLSAADATGANFTNAKLKNTDLRATNLSNANFTNATLRCADTGVDTDSTDVPTLTGATWSNSDCMDGTLSNDNDANSCVQRDVTPTETIWVQLTCANVAGPI